MVSEIIVRNHKCRASNCKLPGQRSRQFFQQISERLRVSLVLSLPLHLQFKNITSVKPSENIAQTGFMRN